MMGTVHGENNATVEDISKILLELIAQGKGHYDVMCNSEYMLAKKGDFPEVSDDEAFVDF